MRPPDRALPPEIATPRVDSGTEMFGYSFASDSLGELADAIATTPASDQGARLVVTANVDHIVQLQTNAALAEAYRNSWKRTIDGMPVWLYARFSKLAISERVTGADLFPAVMARLSPAEHRPFFVVANTEIGQRLKTELDRRGFGPSTTQYLVPPFGFENDAEYGKTMIECITKHRTTHLFFGVGCPRSEVWISQNRSSLGDVHAMAVGAALAFFVGVERRAPEVMRDVGLEWLWRVAFDPKRLTARYFIHSWRFLAALIADVRLRRSGQ